MHCTTLPAKDLSKCWVLHSGVRVNNSSKWRKEDVEMEWEEKGLLEQRHKQVIRTLNKLSKSDKSNCSTDL